MTNIYHLDLSLSLVYIPFLYFSYTLSFYSFTPLSLFPFHPPPLSFPLFLYPWMEERLPACLNLYIPSNLARLEKGKVITRPGNKRSPVSEWRGGRAAVRNRSILRGGFESLYSNFSCDINNCEIVERDKKEIRGKKKKIHLGLFENLS